MKSALTLTALVASLGAASCNPLEKCDRVVEVPVVDDIQAERGALPFQRVQLCEYSDGSFTVYRDGRIQYTAK